MACTMLGVSMKVNAVEKMIAEGPLSLYDVIIYRPNSGPLMLLAIYVLRRLGPYSLLLHFLWPVTLDLVVGALYEHTAKKFFREMARLLNRYLKEPDKQPYKRKTLSLVVSCFTAPGVSVLVYIQRKMMITELFLLNVYFYLLQGSHAPYTACISTALVMLDSNYFPIAVFTSVYCLSWTFLVPRASTRRYRNYIFKVAGRLLHIVILQLVLIAMLIVPFALMHDDPAELLGFIGSRLHAMFVVRPESVAHSGNNMHDPHSIPLPSFWDIVCFLKAMTSGRFDDLTDYIEDNSLWVWSAVTVIIFVGINLSIMFAWMRRHASVEPIHQVLLCFSTLMSFVVFIPERSFTIILPVLTAIYYILLDLISTTSQTATQKGLEHAVATERTHLGLHPIATQRGLMRQSRVTGRCRCTGTSTSLKDVVNIIPTSLASISDTPFACLKNENSSFDTGTSTSTSTNNDPQKQLHQKWLKNYNNLRYKHLSQKILANRNRMITHPFNDLFVTNDLILGSNVYRTLSTRDRWKRADQTSKNRADESQSALKYIRDERADSLFGNDEALCSCLSGTHLAYFNKNIRNGIDTAGSHFLDFLEEYRDRLSHLLPLILQMLFAFYNMYSSVQNTGIVRRYSQVFNVASFLALRRAFKENEKTLMWSLPFLCIDLFGVEWVLLNRGVKMILALFMIMCNTALLAFVGFKFLEI